MQAVIFILNLIAWILILLLIKEPLGALSEFFRFYRDIYRKEKSSWVRRKLNWYLLVHLPNEFISSAIVFIYIFLLFNWKASWLILIAISSFMFKKIIQDPLYILHTYILNLILKHKKGYTSRDYSFLNILPHAIYMPHLGYSPEEIKQALATLFLSYFNNENKFLSLIYHSDNQDPSLILASLRIAKYLKQSFKIKNFYFFQRNTELPEKTFLGKPGAYLADYQLLFTGITHPLIYLEKEWDARIQFKFRINEKNKIVEEKPHMPFLIPERIDSGFEYFIYYPDKKGSFYLKEEANLTTKAGKNYPLEIKSAIYLISKENPENKYLLYMGGIYSLEGELLLRPKEWDMELTGRLSLKTPDARIPQECYQIFTEKLLYLEGKKYFLDPESNIRDENFNIFLPRGSFKLDYTYKLYQRQGNFLYLREEDFVPDFTKIIGKDFRRNPLQIMHKIPPSLEEKIDNDNLFDYFEKETLKDKGILGDIHKVFNFKFGWEKEFLIPDELREERIILKGGYYLIDKNKLSSDIFYVQENALKIQQLGEEIFGQDGNLQFPLITTAGEKITPEDIKEKILIKAPFVTLLKQCEYGYIANEKDNFFYAHKGLYFQEKESTYLVSSNPQELEKRFLYVEPETGDLKSIKQILAPGSYAIEGNTIYVRERLLSKLTWGYFSGRKLRMFHYHKNNFLEVENNYFLNEYGIWSDKITDKIEITDSLKFKSGYIIQEEILASSGEYKLQGGCAWKDGEVYPLGIVIYYKNQPLKFKDNWIFADISPVIMNQTDSDGEFLPESLEIINSLLGKQFLKEKFEYGMIQPEISFANSSDSLFARLLSWAHEEFKFAERAFFKAYEEGNSYGKVSKILPLYINNVLFKESIPAIARTHDHWEAMQLRTLFSFALGAKKSKLVENVPTNFYSFWKRKQGWLAGDLLLLEYESGVGTLLSSLRAFFYLTRKKLTLVKFWIKYSKFHLKSLRERKKFYSALGLQRILTLKRTSLSTSFLMLWLLISGWLVLIIPGSLTAKNILLSWFLFLVSIILIIFLPKFFIPLTTLIIKRIKYLDTLWLVTATAGSIYLITQYAPRYPLITTLFTLLGYGYILIRSVLLPLSFIMFGRRRRLRVRITSGVCSLGLFIILLNGYDILYLLSLSKTFYWIPLLLLNQLPHIFTYVIPVWILAGISRTGRELISTFKEGIKELTATTSTLLMLLVYEPLHILRLVYKLIIKPFAKISWKPQSYFDKIALKINSLLKAYYYFYLPPLFCLLFIIIPVAVHLLPPGILSLGWPIFIWSWLLGPFWAYWTARHRKNLEYIDPSILILRRLIKSNLTFEKATSPQLNQILGSFPFPVSEEIKIKLNIYTLCEKARLSIKERNKSRLDKIIALCIKESPDLRVTNWDSLPEFSQVKIIKKFSPYLDNKLLQEINFYNELLFHMLKKGWAEVEWQHLKGEEKQKIIQSLSHKYFLPSFTLDNLFEHKK